MIDVALYADAENELPRQITCQITPSFTAFDDALAQLQQALAPCLLDIETCMASLQLPPFALDLGMLGTQDYTQCEIFIQYKEQGRALYPIRVSRSDVIFGPFFDPEKKNNPCPRCLERRWFGTQDSVIQSGFIDALGVLVPQASVSFANFLLDGIRHTLLTIFQQRTNLVYSSQPDQPIYVLDRATLHVSRYTLLQDSLCPVCSNKLPDSAESAIVRPQTRVKKETGRYRLVKVTDYALPLSGLVNPVGGMLGRTALPEVNNTLTAPVTGLFHPRNNRLVHDVWWSGHANSYVQSRYAGLLEGVERYAGSAPRNRQPGVFDSFKNMASSALDPRTCGVYSNEFYRTHQDFFQPFTEDMVMPWLWGYSFLQEKPVMVPEQLVYYMSQYSKDTRFVQECSNGCATGSCIEEAILFGLLELIERDAFLLTWYAHLSPPQIDPYSSKRTETLWMLEKIKQQGYELFLLDTRLDVCVPSITCVARRKEPGIGNIVVAAGSGMDGEDALQGALCEVASYIPSIGLRMERHMDALYEMVHDFRKVTSITHHGMLYGLPEMARHVDFLLQNPRLLSVEETYRTWRDKVPATYDLRDDLLFCIEQIKQLGLDVIVVDQTSPEQAYAGLKTVCVIVPGLLPIDFGWGRERVFELPRLCTVPRRLGLKTIDLDVLKSTVLPHPFP